MNVNSAASSALNLINSSQHRAENVAQEIASASIKNDEVGGSEVKADDLFKPIISLKEAELEAKAGAKILQTERESIGAILDIKA